MSFSPFEVRPKIASDLAYIRQVLELSDDADLVQWIKAKLNAVTKNAHEKKEQLEIKDKKVVKATNNLQKA